MSFELSFEARPDAQSFQVDSPAGTPLLNARVDDTDIARTVRRLRLNPARFEADLHSDVTRECVAEDVALGNRLQLPGTPSAFLDGRLVSSTRPEVLEILVRHQLEGRKAGSESNDHEAKISGRPLQRGGPVSGG